MRKKLLLLCASTFFAVVVAEGLLRLLWSNPYAELQQIYVDPGLRNGNIRLKVDRREIAADSPITYLRTDEDGYILPEPRFHNPDATVVFLGGSTTECRAVTEDLRYPHQVSVILEEVGMKVNTLNCSRGGRTLHESINCVFNHLAKRSRRPDYAVIMHAVNDIGVLERDGTYISRMTKNRVPAVKAIGYDFATTLSAQSSFFGLLRNVVTTFEVEKGLGYDAPSSPPSPVPFRANLEIFACMCKSLGIRPVFITQPAEERLKNSLTPAWVNSKAQIAFNDVTREMAERLNVPLVDLESIIRKESNDERRKIFYDGVHITDYGSTVYAKHISDSLRQILAVSDSH